MVLNDRRFFVLFALVGFMLAAAGCQSRDKASAAAQAASAAAAKPEDGKVLESELRAYCPKITLREGTAFFSTYAKGGQDDPTKLVYQASVTDVTRSCARADGQLTMNVAVAGKVVPGPAGAPGTVDLPLRIVVLQGADVVFTKFYKHQAAVGAEASQWVFNEPNVTIPIPAQANIQVFAGFDEGPPKKPAAGSEG